MLGWTFLFALEARYGILCCRWREFDGGEPPLDSQKLLRGFPNFSERFKSCCTLVPGELQVCQAEPGQFISLIELNLQVKLCFGFFPSLCVQIGLSQGRTQAGLPRLGRERLLVFLHCVFPAAALKQKITKKAVTPG